MMKRLDIIIKIIAISMLGVLFFLNGIIYSSASTVEYKFIFSFDENGAQKTNLALKEDDSPLYMYCENSTVPFIASAIGGDEMGWTYDCSYEWESSEIKNYSYLFSNGQKRYIYGFVIQNGFEYGGIKAAISVSGTAEGFWSVDSICDVGIISPNEYLINQ